MAVLSLSLPVAPTANNAFANRKAGTGYGRIKSGKHRSWITQADKHYTLQGLGREMVTGTYSCEMIFPYKVRGDLDGRIKLILDWLVSRKLVEGDSPKHLRGLKASFSENTGGMVQITVRSLDEETPRQKADTSQARA